MPMTTRRSSAKEGLLTAVARKVGHAAGTITHVAHGLASGLSSGGGLGEVSKRPVRKFETESPHGSGSPRKARRAQNASRKNNSSRKASPNALTTKNAAGKMKKKQAGLKSRRKTVSRTATK